LHVAFLGGSGLEDGLIDIKDYSVVEGYIFAEVEDVPITPQAY
jgi:hypothetical protein